MSISIFKFLSRYYGMNISPKTKYSHKDIKHQFEFLKRCSFRYVDHNPELLALGKVIYVTDSYGVSLPYICPLEVVDDIDLDNQVPYFEDEIEKENLFIEEILEFPTYLLRECLAKYKNKASIYRLIKFELISRGVYENKKYKLQKEIDRNELEESDIDDKCKRRRKIKYSKS